MESLNKEQKEMFQNLDRRHITGKCPVDGTKEMKDIELKIVKYRES